MRSVFASHITDSHAFNSLGKTLYYIDANLLLNLQKIDLMLQFVKFNLSAHTMACTTCEVISVIYRNMHTNSDEVMWGVLVSYPDPQERTEGLSNGAAAMFSRGMPRILEQQ